jgi:RimJ/RimL family protein N-acetyltransferase
MVDLRPLSGLRLQTQRLELRLPTRAELIALATLAEEGVHPPEEMPFEVAWTDAIGSPGFRDGFVAFHEAARTSWEPDRWSLLLGVWAGAELIGLQEIGANDFTRQRTVGTGSWLGRRFQGRGYGTEMRGAVLELAFGGLGADAAVSGALEGNIASARVSEKLGYLPEDERFVAPRAVPVREQRYRLSRDRWAASTRLPVQIAVLEPCLPLFGVRA